MKQIPFKYWKQKIELDRQDFIIRLHLAGKDRSWSNKWIENIYYNVLNTNQNVVLGVSSEEKAIFRK